MKLIYSLLVKLLLINLVVILMVGCVPNFSVPPRGSEINPEKIAEIHIGSTPKETLLSLFGAPQAIAIKGEPLYFERKTLQADSFFEIFSTQIEISNAHRVYYYYYSEIGGYTVVIVPFVHKKTIQYIDQLYVLVNEETGKVDGIKYVPRKE